jgi:phosphoglycerol transferase MdoB-like AlkP superfamily enzyme
MKQWLLGKRGKAGAAALSGFILLFIATILRLNLIYRFEDKLRHIDWRGFRSDLAVCLAITAIVALLPKKIFRLAATILLITFILIFYANSDTIDALGNNINFQFLGFLGDATMLKGSILAVSHPILLFLCLCFPALFFYLNPKPTGSWKTSLVLIIIALAFNNLMIRKTPRETFPYWRQLNVFAENLYPYFTGSKDFVAIGPGVKVFKTVPQPTSLNEIQLRDIKTSFSPDLSGDPIGEKLTTKPNILVILAESVPGSFVHSVAPESLRDPIHSVESVSRLSKEGLVYKNFLAVNRQTNRGEYSLLCGKFPNFIQNSAKMDSYRGTEGGHDECLPSYLSRNGYTTHYIQSAPLAFMGKDRFMDYAGFDFVAGENMFDDAYMWRGWGVDDRTLFEGTIKHIDELEKNPDKKPWFITILTTGTHHPYVSIPGFKSKMEDNTFSQTLDYLSFSFEGLYNDLKKRGLDKNTILIFTSDESKGIRKGSPQTQKLSQLWLPMVVWGPGIKPGVTYEKFIQSDFALSFVDQANITPEKPLFNGRSIFRTYKKPRTIPFGNIFSRSVGIIGKKNEILWCDDQMKNCQGLKSRSQHIFDYEYDKIEISSELDGTLRGILAKSEWEPFVYDLNNEYRLASYSATYTVARKDKHQKIYGFQYIYVPKNTTVVHELELEVLEGKVLISETYGSSKHRVKFAKFAIQKPVSKGEIVKVKMVYHTDRALDKTELDLFALNSASSGKTTMKIHKATLNFILNDDKAPREGLLERKFTIVKAGSH